MVTFQVLPALAGGVLIGLSAVLLLASVGRIAGVSSILGGLLARPGTDGRWRAVFLTGLVAGAGLVYAWSGAAPSSAHPLSAGGLVLAGLLVGFGTSLARGCTSGHGVCGLGRLSGRSFAATVTFLVFGIVTTFVVRHVVGVLP